MLSNYEWSEEKPFLSGLMNRDDIRFHDSVVHLHLHCSSDYSRAFLTEQLVVVVADLLLKVMMMY
jgi:hypothetical protein